MKYAKLSENHPEKKKNALKNETGTYKNGEKWKHQNDKKYKDDSFGLNLSSAVKFLIPFMST